MNPSPQKNYAEKFLLFLILGAYIFFQKQFLFPDLWNDEIYTLKYFTCVPLWQTVTDYRAPNNHILFNFINNFLLKLSGEQTVFQLMEHPWVLRIISLLYSFGAIFFTFRLSEKIVGRHAAVLSIIFLLTCIPFLNFAAQIRGYAMGIFFFTAVSYFMFSYFEIQKRSRLFYIFILTAGFIYISPGNFYTLAPVFVFLFFRIIILFFKRRNEKSNQQVNDELKKNSFTIAALLLGIILSLILFSGIFKQVFFNEIVSTSDCDYTCYAWKQMTGDTFIAFFSHRYWLLPMIAAGLGCNFYFRAIPKNKKINSFLFYIFCLLTIPFLISCIRKDALIDRIFLNLIPFFCMLMAWSVSGCFSFISKKKNIFLFQTAVALYCFFNLSFQLKAIDNYLMKDILASHRSHNMYYNYYLAHYNPLKVIRNFYDKVYHDSDLVFILDSEPNDVPVYCDKFHIPISDTTLLDSALNTTKRVFLFTRFPGEVENVSFRQQHKCNAKQVSDGVSYSNVFELTAAETIR